MPRLLCLLLASAVALGAPTLALAGITIVNPDHFKCYGVKGEIANVPVHLTDALSESIGGTDARVLKPELLCLPTEKAFDETTTIITNPDLVYLCYTIKDELLSDSIKGVDVTTQFGTVKLEILRAGRYLCAPLLLDGTTNPG